MTITLLEVSSLPPPPPLPVIRENISMVAHRSHKKIRVKQVKNEKKKSIKRRNRLVWLFAINRTTIPRIYNCSELVCAIVDLGTVGLSVMCAHYGHNLFISLCKN